MVIFPSKSTAVLLVMAAAVSQLAIVNAFRSLAPVSHFSESLQVNGRSSSSYIALSCRFSLTKSQQTEVATVGSTPALEASLSSNDNEAGPSDQASKWRAEAERIRREAAQMDSALTLDKIASVERKLANQSWLKRNPDQEETLKQQLENLQNKLAGKPPTAAKTHSGSYCLEDVASKGDSSSKELNKPMAASSVSNTEKKTKSNAKRFEENPLSGFDQEDLDLYIPVVHAIDERMPENATMMEKLQEFRAAPELQEHFQEKIRKMLVEPMEDMIRLENLKREYLASSSSVERKQLRREMDQLEKTMEDDSPYMYSDSVFLEDLPPLEGEEIQQRMEAVGSLHPILQAMYKQRCGIDETGDLLLAIEMDHYEPQLQLLEQVRNLEPITDSVRHEIRVAILSLPMSVRNHFAEGLGLESGEDIAAMIEELVDGEGNQWLSLQDVVVTTNGESDDSNKLDLAEYRDIDFMDRSRYVQEFIPAVTSLEMIHPSMEDIDTLMKEVLDRNFMVTSAPERVIGGYYIRGHNMLSEPESGSTDDLVSYLQERLKKSSLIDKLDLFYIQDPSPPTDEDYEAGGLDRPVLLVTAKNREEMYNAADPAMKVAVSLLGLVGAMLFAAATTEMQPFMRDQVEAAAAGDMSVDISPIFSSATQVFASMIAIQIAHELGHRVIAFRDKFDIGLPTLVPSIQLGLQGAITPFKSPPPSNKSMFDFALAGPLAGLAVSIALLVVGLDSTASMDLAAANQLPAFPISFLRSSALGGGLIEFFIGKGALLTSAGDAVLPLHPFAIAGFAGMISNSLALLPLGNTDGGRIAQVMFGRRGAYLVKLFTVFVLCSLGVIGLDEPRLFLTYVLFSMIWQRELEAPTLNEADELDFQRGLVGIGSAIIVFLALLPMV